MAAILSLHQYNVNGFVLPIKKPLPEPVLIHKEFTHWSLNKMAEIFCTERDKNRKEKKSHITSKPGP